MSRESWDALWRRAGARLDDDVWYGKLVKAYGDPNRSYHTIQHLEECLAGLDEAMAVANVPNAEAIEMALWFHDAIYDPKASDNEERSAALAREAMEGASISPDFIADVVRLILSTKTHTTGAHDDARWMIDIDLSILGRDQKRFEEYEAQIRAEYAWVPADVYAEKRAEILEGFLARERLFSTEYFHQRYEPQARANQAGLIASLRNAGR